MPRYLKNKVRLELVRVWHLSPYANGEEVGKLAGCSGGTAVTHWPFPRDPNCTFRQSQAHHAITSLNGMSRAQMVEHTGIGARTLFDAAERRATGGFEGVLLPKPGVTRRFPSKMAQHHAKPVAPLGRIATENVEADSSVSDERAPNGETVPKLKKVSPAWRPVTESTATNDALIDETACYADLEHQIEILKLKLMHSEEIQQITRDLYVHLLRESAKPLVDPQ